MGQLLKKIRCFGAMNSSLVLLRSVIEKRLARYTVPSILGSIIFLLFSAPESVHADPLQQLNLPAPSAPRFTLTDRVWPAAHGQADVCLWDDDKLAALSVGIDDNWTSDHKFWKGMTEKYGYHFTWWVMIDAVSFWAIWQKMFDAGHDIQGHDYCSINSLPDAGYEGKLTNTRDVLNRMVKGNQAVTYAYPCGVAKMDIAKKMYISARGTVGGFNPANQINYMQTRPTKLSAANITTAIANRHWMVSFYHGIGSEGILIDSALSHAKNNEADLWTGVYSDVARYAQERDSHTLTVDDVQDTAVTFTVTDAMNDTFFTYPLCVKVRVNNDWEYATTVQGTLETAANVVEDNGNKYVLAKAVPDMGPVTVAKSTAPVSGINRTGAPNTYSAASENIMFFTVSGNPVTTPVTAGLYLRYDGNGLRKVLITD